MTVRIGIPNRGRISQLSMQMIFSNLNLPHKIDSRKMVYRLDDEDLEVVLFRSTDIPKLLEEDVIQIGITGNDYYLESGVELVELRNLYLLNGMLCVLTHLGNSANSILDLKNQPIICYSQYDYISKLFFNHIGAQTSFKRIDGSAESYLYLNLGDVTVDVVASGESYVKNNLKVIYPLFPVSSHIYTTKNYLNREEDYLAYILKKMTGMDLPLPADNERSNTLKLFYDSIKQVG